MRYLRGRGACLFRKQANPFAERGRQAVCSGYGSKDCWLLQGQRCIYGRRYGGRRFLWREKLRGEALSLMDSQGQLVKFLTCVALGLVGGVIYEIASLLALPWPRKTRALLRGVADVVFFLLFAILCVWVLTMLNFSAFREYYYLGFAVGLILYIKTFHKALAFLKKMCYNIITKLVKCPNNRKNFRKKGEKKL